MKKLILVCLLLVPIFGIHAQTLNGVSKFTNGACFTSVNWEVSYSFQLVPEGVAIQFYNPRITVSSSSEYYTKGQVRYSKQSLGLSAWPDENQNPQNMVISFTVSHIDGYGNPLNSQPCNNGKFAPTIVLRKSYVKNWENISISSFRVISTQRMMYNNIGSIEVDNIIEAKKNSNSSNISNSNSNNSATQTSTTNTGMPANTSGNDPLANYNAPAPQYSNDKTVEAVGQLSNAVTPMLEEWGANMQRRREAREQKEVEEANKKKESTENYFKSQLDLYLKAANRGDENARMKLVSLHSYNLSYGTDFTYYLPNLNSWIETAAKNKNFDAMCFVGRLIYSQENYFSSAPYGVKTKDEAFKILEEAANLGSLDAMTFLGYYYNLKKKVRGGADAEKARYWYSKAAESGCPDAAYNMGMIYRYKTSDSFACVTHKIDKNDTLAFNYFVKSLSNPGYANTLFQEADTRGCHFIDFSYKELAIMYEKGIGCVKDKEMAKKLLEEYMK